MKLRSGDRIAYENKTYDVLKHGHYYCPVAKHTFYKIKSGNDIWFVRDDYS